MALLWKALYGIYKGNVSTINDIEFLDNGFLSIPVSSYNNFSSIYSEVNSNGTPTTIYNYAVEVIGNQADSIYLPGVGIDYINVSSEKDNNRWSFIKTAIPSFFINEKNTLSSALSLRINEYGVAIYIESLNRLILFPQLSNKTSGMYSLDDSKNLVYIGQYAPIGRVDGRSSNGVNWNVLVIEKYESPSDLLNLSLYHNLDLNYNLYTGSGSKVGTQWRYNKDVNYIAQTHLVALFGSEPNPPDSTGGPINPYEPGGESTPGGGDGTFDNDSDQIEMPPLPTLSSANTGFTRIYNPTLSQVQALANYLWTDETVIETIWNHIKQYFENPMEAIIGFNLVPVPVPDGGTENFKLMYIDTGVSMTVAASQFVEVDCGTLEVPLYYGSALDYSPYTKISIFLPYIGMVSVNTDEVMGRTMKVTYRVDICSGSCVASIFVDDNPLYQYSGHCAIPIPISAADFSTYVSSAISVGKLAGAAMLAGAGIVAPPPPITASQHTNQTTTTTTTDTARNPSTGRQITTGSQTVVQSTESSSEQSSTKASYNGLTPQSVSNTVGDVISSKPHVEHSGSFSGNSGYLGVRRPYMILQRPRMCMPGNYQQFNGFPCMMSLNLGECSGFTRVQQVHLTGLWATNPEQAEILELLKMGVVL